MGKANKRNRSNSKWFTIALAVAALLMVGIVAATVVSTTKEEKNKSKTEYSGNASVSAVSLNGTIGESTLPRYGEFNPDGSDPAVGLIVPEITGQNFEDEDVVVTPGKKPYALAFVAHWCAHCQKEVPKLVSLHDSGSLPKDVEFIAITTKTNPKLINYPPSKWLTEEEWPWRRIADDEQSSISSKFGPSGWPYLIFVNADGTISQRLDGERSSEEYVAAAKKISELSR